MICNEEKIINEAVSLLTQHGINISTFIDYTGKRNSSIFQLNDSSYKMFASCYEQMINGTYKKEHKGKLLEKLVSCIFIDAYPTIFNCRTNCRTSTNEIDILLNWSESARLAHINDSFPCFGESFLCECKNYSKAVDVTYVGKFYSLLKVTNSQLGILVSWEGVTGKGPWYDSKGLIKKIALKENIYIIAIDKKDLKEIYENKNNIFSLIYDKYISLKNDIDYSQYIKCHENETKFRNLT